MPPQTDSTVTGTPPDAASSVNDTQSITWVEVTRIHHYARNPRRQANPEYHRIKASIRAQGLDQPLARRLVKLVKDSKLKVQVSIQGDKLRVSGKKRDDLQDVIRLVKEANIDLPLQYINFRD